MLLQHKVAIITGGSRGIGREIAHAFADQGASIALVGRSKEALEKVKDELIEKNTTVISFVCDVTNEIKVKEMVELTIQKLGDIDILVNNAGSAGQTLSIESLLETDWDDVVDSNLKSTFLCTKAVIPSMKRKQGGRIINMSSISGKRPLQYRAGYCAAKMGVIGFTRTAATELGQYNITVNSICPGFVAGERIDDVILKQAKVRNVSKEQLANEFKKASPLHRFVRPADIAATTVFLASDHGGGITGEDVNVSAGVVMY